MHDHESSYYEIALTNRQVVVFFVVLLVCVVGAFFSGVWLGQRRAAEMPLMAQAEAAEEAVESPEPLEELNFFTDDPVTPPQREQRPPVSGGGSETPRVEAVGGSERATTRQETPRREPAVAPPLEGAATEAPEPSAVPAPQPAALADGFVIQVFSSPDGRQARKLLDRLVDGGYQAFLSPVEVDGRTMYRVRLGPLETRGEADSLATEVGKAYQIDTWVTRNE